MKPAFYVLAFLMTGVACYFTLEHTNKFGILQADRLATIEKRDKTSAFAEAKEKELKDERAVLAEAKNQQDILTQSIAALKSTGSQLQRDVAELDATLDTQKEEFAELERTMNEVREILAGLGDDITFDNLTEKIEQIDEDKNKRLTRIEELETLLDGAEAVLSKNKEELDRLVQRKISRDARIGRNAMEAVITSVSQDWGFVVIGAGSNSGFTPQTSLIIQRDGRIIGRIRPSSIEPTQTIAEIDFDSLATGVRLQAGDRAILEKPVSN
jgi:hypothetical protein